VRKRNAGLAETLEKYYDKPFEHEARSIVAGPSFMQFLNKLFRTQIASGDILQFESGDHDKYFMFSLTGTWDEIIKPQWAKRYVHSQALSHNLIQFIQRSLVLDHALSKVVISSNINSS
jgi:hypothetical protein